MSVAMDPAATASVPPVQAHEGPLLNLAAFDDADAKTDPYQHILVDDLLNPGVAARLEAEYPTIDVTGYITVEQANLPPIFQQLVEELKGPGLTDQLSKKFKRDFHKYPRMVTIRRWSEAREGYIHTDSKRKVMTMLLYLNPAWVKGSEGSLRVLYDENNFEPFAMEIPPLNGTTFAFTRSDNSWHGHLPYEGERRVFQVTWLRDDKAMNRKMSNNSFHQKLKRFFKRKKDDKPADMM